MFFTLAEPKRRLGRCWPPLDERPFFQRSGKRPWPVRGERCRGAVGGEDGAAAAVGAKEVVVVEDGEQAVAGRGAVSAVRGRAVWQCGRAVCARCRAVRPSRRALAPRPFS